MKNVAMTFVIGIMVGWGCREIEVPREEDRIDTDAELFTLITQTQPLTSYILFPLTDSVTSGTLNGSQAHQPLVSVSMNATAYNSLRGDTLPNGQTFADGSIIAKRIIEAGQTTLYAVMYKDRTSSLEGHGWLWAELTPSGTAFYSITNRGDACTGCHLLERGSVNDLVRTFERQMR